MFPGWEWGLVRCIPDHGVQFGSIRLAVLHIFPRIPKASSLNEYPLPRRNASPFGDPFRQPVGWPR